MASIPAGTYANTVVFSAVANYVQRTITISFDGNGSDGGSMANQYIDAGTSQNLNPNGFTRTGFIFSGWNTEPDGTGTSYADQASYQAPAEPSSYSVTLYAQWKEVSDNLQGFTNAQCQAVASSGDYTVTDLRDNNDYTVRYINGDCWMTQNLRIAGGTTLNSSTSNVASSYTIPTTDLTIGDNSHTQGEIHDSGNTTTGYWYNFCAASAGTVCSQTQQDASYDICPKGWRLPTRTEFDGINGTSYISAFLPVTGGFYYNGSLNDTSYGYWWSSTAGNSYYQYLLYYDGSSLYTSGYNEYGGFYVRCIRSS